MGIDKVLVVHLKSTSKENKLTLKTVERALSKHKISYTKRLRTKLHCQDFQNIDLIIVVGGDGTFLRTSHFVKDDAPVFGVNSDIHRKEGFFTRADRRDFEAKLKLILKNKFSTCKLTRLKVTLNSKIIPELALNEVFIGDYKPYTISNYIIHIEGKQEKQRSSGLIVGTAAGSHAWVRSAGGKVLPLESKDYQLIVREPYAGRLSSFRLTNKTIKANCCISVSSLMKNGIVVIDSLSKEYPFKIGSKLKIRPGLPIRFVCFGKKTWVGLK